MSDNCHTHKTSDGLVVRCYHKCRTWLTPGFWIGMTIGYPIEHFLWEGTPLRHILALFVGDTH